MDDAAAIRSCRSGDANAFRYLVERYQNQAMAHAVAILGNPTDAEDALQEAFLDAYRALDRFDEGRSFYSWFYTILRNRCWKLLGSRNSPDRAAENVEILAASGGTLDQTLALGEALARLQVESREILTLRHLDGLSYEEFIGPARNSNRHSDEPIVLRAETIASDFGRKAMTCEEWRVAAMALADGEMPPVSRAAIETHLVTCDGCRRVIEDLQELASTWDGQRRPDCYVDLWPAIQDRLRRPKRHWLPMLVALLVTFKLADLVTDTSLALWVQVVPVLMAAAAFALLRQNPFRIQTDLALKEAEL